MLIEFKNELRRTRAPATVNKYIHYIYTVWETARLNWGIILPPNNPTALVKREKVMTKIERILSDQEYQDLFAARFNSMQELGKCMDTNQNSPDYWASHKDYYANLNIHLNYNARVIRREIY